jgi:hypothetical protein
MLSELSQVVNSGFGEGNEGLVRQAYSTNRLKNEKKRYCEDLKNEIDPAIRRILNCEDNQFISFSLTDNREDTRIELVIYTSKGTPCAVVYGYFDGRFAVQGS